MWSWPVEAGILGIGEVLAALRDDLILPSDAAPGLLRINGRKIRGRAARHQAARVDPLDPSLKQFSDACHGSCGLFPPQP